MDLTSGHRSYLTALTIKSQVVYGGNRDPVMAELVAAGYVKATAVNLSEVLYEITPEGRLANKS